MVSEVTQVRPVALLADGDPLSFAAVLADLVIGAGLDGRSDLAQRLRTLSRQLPVIVWATDSSGTFTLGYGMGLRRLDLEDDEGVGLHISTFGPEAEAFLETAQSGQPTSFVLDGHTDGEPWRFNVYAVPRADGEGVIAMAVDVTGELNAEQQGRDLLRSEHRFRLLAESSPIGIVVIDDHGLFEYANPIVAELCGRPRDELIGTSWRDNIPESERDFVAAATDQMLAGDRPGQVAHRIVRPDGTVRWVRTRAVILADDIAGERIMATVADITDSLLAAERLRESDERTRAIIESAAEGILTCNEAGIIVEFNAAAEGIFGLDSDDAIGTRIEELISPSHRSLITAALLRVETEEKPSREPAREINAQRPDGTIVPVELRLTRVHTTSGMLITGMIRDISERKEFERAIEHQATHDPLTGLPNRAILLAQLGTALARTDLLSTSVAVLFFELDRIEVVIGSFGHRAADEVLREAARRLHAVLGRGATISRFAAGQFVALIEDRTTMADVILLAQRGAGALDEPFRVGEEEVFLSSPVGIAFAASGSTDGEALISNGDVAMRRAKERTDQRLEVFDAEMREWVESRHKLEVALRYGIDRHEFELHYQPIVTIDKGHLVGVEALARWNHPVLGLLPPSDFIPLAEDSGLIVSLGDALLFSACQQLATWQRHHPDLFVSVNLSGHQLGQPDLVNRVAQCLEQAGADPAGLHLEITETILLRDVEAAAVVLKELKDIGVKLCLDDFGTGYSSLTYLCRFPIDVVKIDQSFVSQVGTRSRDSSIVTMILGMAQTLDIDVVAEGVEDRGQLVALGSLGCDMAQGFYHARPTRAEEVEELFDHQFEAARVPI